MRNRRKNPRIRARGLAVHVSANGRRHPCVVENISIGGLFIRTDSLLDLNTDLRVDLVRPGWKKALQLGARVVSRTDPVAAHVSKVAPGMGVQFFGLRGEQRDRLEQLLVELGLPAGATEAPQETQPPDFDFESMRGPPTPPSRPNPQPIELDPLDPQPEIRPLAEEDIDPRSPALGSKTDLEPLLREALRDAADSPPVPTPPSLRPVPTPTPPSVRPVPTPTPPSVRPVTSQTQQWSRPSPQPEIRTPPAPPPDDQIVPPAPPPPPSDSARLMLQIQGLFLELSEAHDQIRQKDNELARLRDEVAALKGSTSR